MTIIPDVCIFQQRVGPMHAQQLASLAKTKRDFSLIYRYGPGTAHENINEVLRRASSRFVAVCDDDVEFLDDHWLDTLIQVLVERQDVGMVVPIEIKDEALYNDYKANGYTTQFPRPVFDILDMAWAPGYVMLFDCSRVPTIKADCSIPGPSGMSDLDLSLQVRQAGFKCAVTTRTVVYHPTKPLDFDWRQRWDIVQEHELPELHLKQMHYMRSKWGLFFEDAIRNQVRGTL